MAKVLTLKEPYAALIVCGVKRIETRSWKTNYRGRLYIHTSASPIPKAYRENEELMGLVAPDSLTFGKIVCQCNLVDCVEMTEEFVEELRRENPTEYIAGFYEPGRYAWILENVEVLPCPIPAKGKLGIWNYTEGERSHEADH